MRLVGRLSYVFLALAGVLALVWAAAAPAARPPAPSLKRCTPGSYKELGNARIAYAATLSGHEVWAFRRPGRAPFARFGRLNVNRYPTVFGIRGAIVDRRCGRLWYRVQLPMRPNGVTGWIRARRLLVGAVRTRIVVDVSARRLTFLRSGKRVLTARVAVGSPATPTPLGRFYVNQRLIPHNTSGPFGPGAIGISAFSNVLTGWAQGGPVAIHGTNRPSSIGHAVSNGCIRLVNQVLRRVFRGTPAGTPVVIHA